ncbi:MAG: putative lipid II flippase FtsW [Bdellovibrionales bacterium]|nr:putative lipid II flippase FtsW [Bdellovibrionales bacterium]
MSTKQLSILDAIADAPSVPREHRYRPPFFSDIPLVVVTVLLMGFGLLMLYSTSGILAQEKFGDALYYLRRQTVAAVLGLVGIVVLSRFKLDWLRRVSPLLLLVCLGMLLFPLIPGVGVKAGGASRWVNLLGFRFQPGELVKLLFIIFMAGYFGRREAKLHQFSQGVVKPLFLVGLVGVLYLLQPDFGSTSLVLSVTFAMALCAGVRLQHIALSGVVCAIALVALVLTSPYRVRRLLSFLEPNADASGQGYQLIQSLIAVGTGQVSGVGLGASQQKLFFLPAAHTDFIFAVIAEELGFLGGLGLLILFGIFLWRGLRIALRHSEDTFAFSLGIGMTLLIVAPALLNLGVVLGLLPTKGLALPFISYGGTSTLVSMIAVGILLALARESAEHGYRR